MTMGNTYGIALIIIMLSILDCYNINYFHRRLLINIYGLR
jgi:hypothetical protein